MATTLLVALNATWFSHAQRAEPFNTFQKTTPIRSPLLFSQSETSTATLTVHADVIGSTPSLLAYNSGHFYPNSNTRDWWRYSGVSGARVFLTADLIETVDDIPGRGDGVIDQTSFLVRKAALRSNPDSNLYINWSVFLSGYNSIAKHGANRFRPNYIFTELRSLGVKIDVNIGASQNIFTISSSDDWAGKWELWQHYYAQAFYLGREFQVERFQMYNEPDHPNAGGLTTADYLQRLQLCSDAIQSALSDLNSIYGKSLVPRVLAPVATTALYGDWGKNVVTNRHLNFLGQTDPAFSLLHQYDYHQYNASPAQFGILLGNLRSTLADVMSPEPPPPVSISEWNVHTAGVFDTMPDTLDSATKYPRLGAIAVNLVKNGMNELYNFKLSQTDGDAGDAYPVRKNGMHYVDNSSAPYNIGGITKAGEVWRLFNKGLAPGRQRLNTSKSAEATGLEVESAYDPVSRRYYIFSANHTTNAVNFDLDLTALNLPMNGRVLVEEVSEECHGAGRFWTTVGTAHGGLGLQPPNSVWLVTASRTPEESEQIVLAVEDGHVRDGTNKALNYGAHAALLVRNDPNNSDNRSVGFLKFQLPTNDWTGLQYAILSLQASSATISTTAQAHVYGMTNSNWAEHTLTWNNAPNIKKLVPNGNTISHQFVTGQGIDVSILGQVVVSSTNSVEKWIDVTGYLRSQSNSMVSFLISQDPRWNVTLPSLVPGDTQPDGLNILSSESGSGPTLRLVFKSQSATNIPPFTGNDDFTAASGEALVVNAPGVLANDFDADGDSLTAVLVQTVTNGNLALNADGSFTYVASTNYSGIDHFSYKVFDGKDDSNIGTVLIAVNPPGGTPYSTNLAAIAEASIRGGTSAGADQDEAATGYLMVKYNESPFNTSRKTYLQFDLTGLGPNLETQAVLTVTTHTTNSAQRAQLWGLNQEYTGFTPQVSWNVAQANDKASNDLLTVGGLTANSIGASVFFTSSISVPYTFTIPRLGDYVFSNRITLVLTGADDAANNAGGLRLARSKARLQLTAGLVIPQITGQPKSVTNATGTTVTFDAVAIGTWPMKYQWRKNGAALMNGPNVSGATTPTLTLQDVAEADAGEYTIVVSNGGGSATSSGALFVLALPPRFESVSILPDGRCRLVLSGNANRTYSVEASTDLLGWALITNILSQSATFEITDSAAPDSPYRFYRAR